MTDRSRDYLLNCHPDWMGNEYLTYTGDGWAAAAGSVFGTGPRK
jgi:hypothetical protein